MAVSCVRGQGPTLDEWHHNGFGPVMISALLLLSVGVLPLLFMAYHFVGINRQPKRLPLTNERVRAPKPPNVRPEDLPRATVKGYLRVQPTIEEQDKIDWDERFKTWQAQQKKTIDADDPELYEILEQAATRRQLP